MAEHPEVVEALRDALLERDELVGSEITEVIESALHAAAKPGVIAELRRPQATPLPSSSIVRA